MTNHEAAYAVVLADLRAQRDMLDKAIKGIEAIMQSRVPVSQRDKAASPKQDSRVEEGKPSLAGLTAIGAIKVVLERAEEAMSPTALLAALEAGGLKLEATNKLNSLSSMLSRRERNVGDVVRLGRGKWGLREWYTTDDSTAPEPPAAPSALALPPSSDQP